MSAEVSRQHLSRKDVVTPVDRTHHRRVPFVRPAGFIPLVETALGKRVAMDKTTTNDSNKPKNDIKKHYEDTLYSSDIGLSHVEELINTPQFILNSAARYTKGQSLVNRMNDG